MIVPGCRSQPAADRCRRFEPGRGQRPLGCDRCHVGDLDVADAALFDPGAAGDPLVARVGDGLEIGVAEHRGWEALPQPVMMALRIALLSLMRRPQSVGRRRDVIEGGHDDDLRILYRPPGQPCGYIAGSDVDERFDTRRRYSDQRLRKPNGRCQLGEQCVGDAAIVWSSGGIGPYRERRGTNAVDSTALRNIVAAGAITGE